MTIGLLVLKNKLKKTWLWLKSHWQIPFVTLLIAVGLLLWALTRKQVFLTALLDYIENSKKDYENQIEIVDKIHQNEIEKRDTILKEYNKNLEKVEGKLAEEEKKLSSAKKRELKKLVEQGYNDPERLSRELARLYGFEHG